MFLKNVLKYVLSRAKTLSINSTKMYYKDKPTQPTSLSILLPFIQLGKCSFSNY